MVVAAFTVCSFCGSDLCVCCIKSLRKSKLGSFASQILLSEIGEGIIDVCAISVSCIELGLKLNKNYKLSLHLRRKNKHPETFAFLFCAM